MTSTLCGDVSWVDVGQTHVPEGLLLFLVQLWASPQLCAATPESYDVKWRSGFLVVQNISA